ncbi:ATP-binding protein [Ramlibacter sp. AN1133]|uniref:ATP-binding protein n=1 Tax=Ramlibacter sp. AN1133 TaxID=3133429 RepID=UPI0030C5ADB1
MSSPILSLRLSEFELAGVRTCSREAAKLVGLEGLQQTRLATAVSEIARNALQHARGGSVEFFVEPSAPPDQGQCLVAQVSDEGPGIADIQAALSGQVLANGRISSGIPGSRRLVDRLDIRSSPPGGTVVRLETDLPRGARPLSPRDIEELAAELRRRRPVSAVQELQQQNRELLRIHQELQRKQAALEQADDRKNQFVKTLVHELRSPLSTLELTLTILRRRPDLGAEELLRRCDVMGRQTKQLTRLVEELMDVARVSQGKADLHKQPSELNALVAEAVEMTGGAIAAKAHDMELHLHPEPLWISADRSRLTQVVCNLIQNSARYTPRNGRIAVDVLRSEGQAVVRVIDNGVGIPGEFLPHVFDLFVQGDTRPPGMEGGLGIGLTLVHHLVASHGGDVSVASAGLDRGSTFTVRLPLIAQPATA